jgi:cytochrome c-type biogenesis protein
MEQVPYIMAFCGGLLAFFSPCVLPLLPAYLSMVSGLSLEEMTKARHDKWHVRKVLLTNSCFFALGFTFVFVLLGASATFVGQFLLSHLHIINKIAGALIVILGLHITGLLKIKYLYYEKRIHVDKKPVGIIWSFVAGMAFAFGWTPCIGPILAGILALAAKQETVNQGIVLLTLFSLGMAIPFVATALLFDLFRKVPLTGGIMRKFEIVTGTFLIFIGVLIFTNNFQALASGFTSMLSGIFE